MAATDPSAFIARADALCARSGETLTPLRRRVLELLLAQEGPMKAYDLLDALKGEHGSAKPPTVYRTLDFLVRMGLAHKIESLNAFIACDLEHKHPPSAMLLCERCGAAFELPFDFTQLQTKAAELGFELNRIMLEASGRCALCQGRPA